MKIKNVLIVGLGAIGTLFAAKFFDKNVNVKVLVDEEHLKRYQKNPMVLNGKEYKFDYILPNATFSANLVLIATKMPSFGWAVDNIKNFLNDDTILMSLLNGVESEEILRNKYPNNHCLESFYLGSSVRTGNVICAKESPVIFGATKTTDFSSAEAVKQLFDKTGVIYKFSDDIKTAMWKKYMLNVAVNEVSAIYELNYGELLKDKEKMELFYNLMTEVQLVAHEEGIELTEKMKEEAIDVIKVQYPNARTSMCQDVLAKRKKEVDIFAGTLIRKAKKYGIKTPCAELVYKLIKEKEEKF